MIRKMTIYIHHIQIRRLPNDPSGTQFSILSHLGHMKIRLEDSRKWFCSLRGTKGESSMIQVEHNLAGLPFEVLGDYHHSTRLAFLEFVMISSVMYWPESAIICYILAWACLLQLGLVLLKNVQHSVAAEQG